MKLNAEPIEFEGTVGHIYQGDDYGERFVVSNYRNDADKAKLPKGTFPQSLELRINRKNNEDNLSVFNGIREGDFVRVKFFLVGKSGVSKRTGKFYSITELALAKKDGIVLVKAAEPDMGTEPDLLPTEEMPF